MEFGIATNTSIPNLLMPSAGPPKKPMELDNVATRPAEPNTVPKASIVSLGEPAVHADPLPTTGSVPTPPEKLTITTSTSIPNPLTPSAGCPPEKLMELDIANAGQVSEPLPFTAGLPENLMELDNATMRPVTESLEFHTGPPMEPNAVPEIPIISLQEPAVNADALLNSTNMDHKTTIPLPEPMIATAQPVRLERQPNIFC